VEHLDQAYSIVRPIYLDYNATTPVDSEVLDEMLPFLREEFGNPSSAHSYGRRAHDAVEQARARVAAFIGASADEIVFTASGTEATNLAIRGVLYASQSRRGILTSAFEHPATAETCAWLEKNGFGVTRAPVGRDGRVVTQGLAEVLGDETALVTVMHAHNELGTIQPIADLAALARRHGCVMHTDAAQTLGKIPVDVDALGVDLLTIAGHKLYAPKGIGALYIRRGTKLEPVLTGAGHEQGRRPGTENVAGIVGLGKACEVAERDMTTERMRLRGLRDQLLLRLRDQVPGLVLHGHATERLPNTLFVSFPGVAGARLLESTPQVAASTGSACHSGSAAPCAALLAIGVEPTQAVGPVRLSLGRNTTVEEVEQAAEALVSAWNRLSVQSAVSAS
jgi:cysteine desulfurase